MIRQEVAEKGRCAQYERARARESGGRNPTNERGLRPCSRKLVKARAINAAAVISSSGGVD
jgi:hypothetical protein